MKERFLKWLYGETDPLADADLAAEAHDATRAEMKERKRRAAAYFDGRPDTQRAVATEQRTLRAFYRLAAVVSCVVIIGVLLFLVANLPLYGEENARASAVSDRYVESGVEETGAVNVVAGMILDYRAFDTLGESHVLFTALVCVMILLGLDRKNMRSGFEDYYRIRRDSYFDTSKDQILRVVGFFLVPCIFLYGFYVLLNGQNGPGGGFSGGAVLGTGMVIFTSAFGFSRVDRFFTRRLFLTVSASALCFYSFAKGYVFFTGGNGIENGIPKGTPGAILSGGLILPLDIAVGLVVACTMFGFFSLFRRGRIGA